MSRARNDLQHLGSPPVMLAASSDHQSGFALCGRGEQFVGHDHQSPQVALGMVAQGRDQARGHQCRSGGLGESVAQTRLEFIWRGAFDGKTHTHTAGQRKGFLSAKALDEASGERFIVQEDGLHTVTIGRVGETSWGL
jgi:hypothetical protein